MTAARDNSAGTEAVAYSLQGRNPRQMELVKSACKKGSDAMLVHP